MWHNLYPTLHWLRVPERVQYKIAVLTYNVLHDSAPLYLGPLVAVADLPGRRAVRSASTSRLVIPPIKVSTVGNRAFPVAVAQVWNSLPEAVISSSLLQSFRRQLKTHLFKLSYPHLILWLLVWHRYSGLHRPYGNIVIYATLKIYVYLLSYLLSTLPVRLPYNHPQTDPFTTQANEQKILAFHRVARNIFNSIILPLK